MSCSIYLINIYRRASSGLRVRRLHSINNVIYQFIFYCEFHCRNNWL